MERPDQPGGSLSFEEEISRDLEWAEALVEEALLAGAAEAEVYAKASATTGIYLGGGFSTLSGGTERGVALRVFDGKGRFGHAFSSRIEGSRLQGIIEASLAALREAADGGDVACFPADRFEGEFPHPAGILDPGVVNRSLEQKRGMLEAALHEASWARPAGIAAGYRDGISRITLANSRGVRAGYARTLSLATLTRAGEGGPTLHAEWISPGPDPAGVMDTALGLARIQTSGGDEEIEWEDLLVESAAAISIVRHLLPDLVEDPALPPEPGGTDFRRVASDVVTVVDDGLLPGGVASAPFDGEGKPTGRLTLVKAGVRIDRLRSWRPGERGRPGCAIRPSYRDLPRPGGTNLHWVPGERSLPEMMAGMGRGFLLAALEGDVREEAAGSGESRWRGMGWQIQGGERVGPCRRLLFRAEPGDLLGGILEVSSRLSFSLRHGMAVGVPDLLIRRRR